MYCLPLDSALTLEEAGGKAASLSRMLRSGVPVPPGFVISSRAFTEFSGDGNDRFEELEEEIGRYLEGLHGTRFMVRSSAIGEDSKEASFAGQLDSFITDGRLDAVIGDLRRCWDSYSRENVLVYQREKNVTLAGMGVIVQELIDPDYAGVLFTRSYENDGEMLCEYVEGHGERLVSGEVNPGRFHAPRATGIPDAEIPFDFGELYRLALYLEEIFQQGVDIEWAIRGGMTYIVQSRPLTFTSRGRTIHWSNTNVNENYPSAITPLLYSIARDSYYHYFRNLSRLLQVSPESIRELEPDYVNIIGAFGCRMYYNMTSIHTIIGHSPFASLLRKSFDNFVGYQEGEKKSGSENANLRKMKFIASFSRLGWKLGENVREFERRADAYERRSQGVLDQEALRACFHEFIEIRMHGWYRASLADFFAMIYHGLLGLFCSRYFGEGSQGIHNRVIQAIPGLVSSRPVAEIWKIAEMIRNDPDALDLLASGSSGEFLGIIRRDPRFASIDRAIADYLRLWGFRCSGELMLTQDTFADSPEKFIDLLRGYIDQPGDDPEKIIREKGEEREVLMRDLRRRLLRRRGVLLPVGMAESGALRLLVHLCFAGIASRERVRLKQAQLYYRFKKVIGAIGEEFARRSLLDKSDDIVFLRYQEIAEHLTSSDMLSGSMKDIVALRKGEFAERSTLEYPDDFSSYAGEYPSPSRLTRPDVAATAGASIKGLSACGGYVKGRARVLESVMELGRIRKGDILVTRQTDPGWATVFPLISGLIVERGGMLSHGAIVAREFGIPAIVGVPHATSIILDGEEIELNADTGEVYRNVSNDTALYQAAM